MCIEIRIRRGHDHRSVKATTQQIDAASRVEMIACAFRHCACWIAAGATDMQGAWNGLAALGAETALAADPFCGHVAVFPRPTQVRLLWWSGDG